MIFRYCCFLRAEPVLSEIVVGCKSSLLFFLYFNSAIKMLLTTCCRNKHVYMNSSYEMPVNC